MIARMFVLCVCTVFAWGADGLTAFSMKEAERVVRSNAPQRAEAEQLGGISHLVGMVYDPDEHDVVLVGRRVPEAAPLDLPSLAVAMRAVLVLHQWPLVSIDPTPQTARTRKQKVRLEGGLFGNQFGMDFLLADIRLKHLGMGLVNAPELTSYFDRRAKAVAAAPTRGEGGSRFWFYAVDPGLEQRDGVFVIRRLRLGVRAETVSAATTIRGQILADNAAEVFASEMSNVFGALCETFPDLARLQGLYELIAVARGLEAIEEPSLAYWLNEYEIPRVETPAEFELVSRQKAIKTAIGQRDFTVSGGIQFAALTIRLHDGDITALKEAVLLARPTGGALTWAIPVDERWLDDTEPLSHSSAVLEDSNAGAHISWQMTAEPRPSSQPTPKSAGRGVNSTTPTAQDPSGAEAKPGGIKADIEIGTDDVERKTGRKR